MKRRILFFGGYLGLCLTCLMPVAARLMWLRFREVLGGDEIEGCFGLSAVAVIGLMAFTSFVMMNESTQCDD